ncbi:MAG: lipoate--protein ligase family protein [Bacillota bacterium]
MRCGLSTGQQSRWRLLQTGFNTAAVNMAVDEAILLAHSQGLVPPTLRFYGWKPPAVSIGYFQRLEEEVDLEACRRLGIDWVKRPTGGRAVLHDQEVTYSVVIAQQLLPGSVVETYRILAAGLVEGLRMLGLPAALVGRDEQNAGERGLSAACFDAPSWYEIAVQGRKVVGSAQTRSNGVILQHGSVPIVFDAEKLVQALKLLEGARSRVHRLLAEKAGGISDFLGYRPTFAEVAGCLTRGFAAARGIELVEGVLTPEEEKEAERLAREKYGSDWWNKLGRQQSGGG